MSIKVTEHNDVKVYHLSAGKTLPQFLTEAKKGGGKKTFLSDEYRKRIEILQDFEFNTSSTRVRVTKDRQNVVAVGGYPPEVRVYEPDQLGMKFLRRLDSEILDFQFLGDDWRKMVFLCTDRTLEFHAQYGKHHKVRIPKFGRTLLYNQERCNLFVAGSSSEVYRLDLEEGIFLEPLQSEMAGVNAIAENPALPLMSIGGEGGLVESWDLRDPRRPVATVDAFLEGDDLTNGRDVTALAFSGDGMKMGVGLGSGVVRVYDIRSQRPMSERDHYNGLPIQSLQFHRPSAAQHDSELCVSADEKSIKLWGYGSATGELFTSLENESKIQHFEMWPDSGLMFVANDAERLGAYFIPALGIAPKWCSFLDSMTEELEENPTATVFDQFQFVSKEQLHQLDADHLIGTDTLRPYMHGYLIDVRVFRKLKMASEPFAYEEYRKKKITERVEAKRKMRTKEKAKVASNAELREQLEEVAAEAKRTGASAKRKRQGDSASKLLGDDRFKKLFDNPDFEIEKVAPK